MILYRSKLDRDTEVLCHQLRKASEINSHHLPLGFHTVASFDFGNIYVNDDITPNCVTLKNKVEVFLYFGFIFLCIDLHNLTMHLSSICQ